MQDQVSNFNRRGINSDYFCSTRTEKERAAIMRGLQTATSDLRLLFVTPETFSSEQYDPPSYAVLAESVLLLCVSCSLRENSFKPV